MSVENKPECEHNWFEVTRANSMARHFTCGLCGAWKTEPHETVTFTVRDNWHFKLPEVVPLDAMPVGTAILVCRKQGESLEQAVEHGRAVVIKGIGESNGDT
jgi:hypothetical protein